MHTVPVCIPSCVSNSKFLAEGFCWVLWQGRGNFHWYFYEGVFRLAEVIRSPKARRNQWPLKPSDRKMCLQLEILIPEIHIGRDIPYEKIPEYPFLFQWTVREKNSLHSFLFLEQHFRHTNWTEKCENQPIILATNIHPNWSKWLNYASVKNILLRIQNVS